MNRSTRQSMVISAARGMLPWLKARISLRAPQATPKPATAPRAARHKPSIRHCRARSQKVAPMAFRTAISWWRDSARASRRFPTLTQAISRTKPTAASITSMAGFTLPTISSWYGISHQCVEFRIEGMSVGALVRFLLRHDALEFLERSRNANARFEPSDDILEMAGAAAGIRRVDLLWKPKLGRVDFAGREGESGWHHTENSDGKAIDFRSSRKDIAVASECPLPEAIGDDHCGGDTRAVVIGRDPSPGLRCNTKCRHQAAGDARGGNAHGLRVARQISR